MWSCFDLFAFSSNKGKKQNRYNRGHNSNSQYRLIHFNNNNNNNNSQHSHRSNNRRRSCTSVTPSFSTRLYATSLLSNNASTSDSDDFFNDDEENDYGTAEVDIDQNTLDFAGIEELFSPSSDKSSSNSQKNPYSALMKKSSTFTKSITNTNSNTRLNKSCIVCARPYSCISSDSVYKCPECKTINDIIQSSSSNSITEFSSDNTQSKEGFSNFDEENSFSNKIYFVSSTYSNNSLELDKFLSTIDLCNSINSDVNELSETQKDEKYAPLRELIMKTFQSYDSLNESFRDNTSLSFSNPGLNYKHITMFYDILLRNVPAKHGSNVLCKALDRLLHRPKKIITKPDHLRALLIILENPLFFSLTPQFNTAYDTQLSILKRVFGMLASSPPDCKIYLINWFMRISSGRFLLFVNLLNNLITNRIRHFVRRIPVKQDPMSAFADQNSKHTESAMALSKDYINDWPLRIFATMLSLFFFANSQTKKIADNNFYNLLAEYADLKADFMKWVKLTKSSLSSSLSYGLFSNKPNSLPSLSSSLTALPEKGSSFNSRMPGTNRRDSYLIRSTTNSIYHPEEYDVLYNLDYYTIDDNNSHHYNNTNRKKITNFTTNNIVNINDDLNEDNETLKENRSINIKNNQNTYSGTFTHYNRMLFCSFPFLLSMNAKIRILRYDSRKQMDIKFHELLLARSLQGIKHDPHVVLRIRRDCLLGDSFSQLKLKEDEIGKRLRIEFLNEDGIDGGGLKKEWFMLLTKELFNPLHGLFVTRPDSSYCWFNYASLESSELYHLVGMVVGLAIYNSVTIDVPIPKVFFKRLLGLPYNLDDLADIDPPLAKGLRTLLNFDGNIEETYCRDFVYEQELYGIIRRVSLLPSNASLEKAEATPLNQSNRDVYVRELIRLELETSISRQFEPFKSGFFRVVTGSALKLFSPEEAEQLFRGSEEPFDVDTLKAVTVYLGWDETYAVKNINNNDTQTQRHRQRPERRRNINFSRIENRHNSSNTNSGSSHISRTTCEQPKIALQNYEDIPVVKWFWKYFKECSFEKKKKLLIFITGSDRVPPGGAGNMIFKVCRLQEVDKLGSVISNPSRFPISRTCFNQICLYEYQSEEIFVEKMNTALEESEGFGLR